MLDSLHRRPLGVAVASYLDALTRGRVPAGSEGVRRIADVAWRELASASETGTQVTDRLYARLDEDELGSVRARLSEAELRALDEAEGVERKRLTLALSALHDIAPVLERTGLRSPEPPREVHAVVRADERPRAAGGSYYYADLVAEAVESGGRPFEPGTRVLDFGCSSGRVVRVLSAAFPETEWHGCDPLPGAIEWASGELTGVHFQASEREPPLLYPDASFDVVFAISIWSHFGEAAALRWFTEMRRVLRPGAILVFTSHGNHSLVHYRAARQRPTHDLVAVAGELRARGFAHRPIVGKAESAHGIGGQDWGLSWLSTEWVLAKLCPAWSVVDFKPGRAEGNQDVFVLELSQAP